MDANSKTSDVALTRERFHELLNAYMSALDNAAWVVKRKGATSSEYRVASNAAVDALNALEKAVFP